jgi:hypothetical protein
MNKCCWTKDTLHWNADKVPQDKAVIQELCAGHYDMLQSFCAVSGCPFGSEIHRRSLHFKEFHEAEELPSSEWRGTREA